MKLFPKPLSIRLHSGTVQGKIQFTKLFLVFTLCVSVFLLSGIPGQAQEEFPQEPAPTSVDSEDLAWTSATEYPTDQIIIQYKTSFRQNAQVAQEEQLQRLNQTAGVDLQYFREMSGDAQVLHLPARLPIEQVDQICQRLMTLPEVEYAEPDRIVHPAFTPNDPYYSSQWHYYDTYSIHVPGAWDITTGSSNIVVAVIDTGILSHGDLNGRTVPGYDFISDTCVANDGGGRDNDPSDPGDWIVDGDCSGEEADNSSWHGTHVAGTIGANSNNGLGVAGINWSSKILPIRVLGKGGGYDSDIIDAIRWAAGLSVGGVPANQNPAKVLNLSLSGLGSCTTSVQSAITDAYQAGAVIVVAAGNDASSESNYYPANCSNVITVAATNKAGNRSSYSNYGSVVEISAPGGDSTYGGVYSTSNTGSKGPIGDSYAYKMGTSMAAPHVSGVVSLMLSRNPLLSPAEVLSILQNTAQPFPSGSNCNTSQCGSGIVNAAGAVFHAVPFTPRNFVYLPSILKQIQLPSWTVIKSETFEGSFPNSWSVFDNDGSTNGTYTWAKKNCQAYEGSYSGWAVGGGTDGNKLACSAAYPNNANSWMEYGPFSLSDAAQAQLRYMLWLYSELNYDCICQMASIDGKSFYGNCLSGNSNGWIEQVFDLSDVYTLGNLRGQTQVWIALKFDSDSSNTLSYGALVDNITLRKCTNPAGCASPASSSSATGNNLIETPMMIQLNP